MDERVIWNIIQRTAFLATEVTISPQFLNIAPSIRDLERILDYQEGSYSSSTLDFLILCNDSVSNIDDLISRNYWKQNQTSSHTYENHIFVSVRKDPSKCPEVFNNVKKDIQRSYAQINDYLLADISYSKYLLNVEEIFTNSSRNLSTYEDFLKCEKNKDQIFFWDNLYYKIAQIGKNISESLAYEEAYNYAELLFMLFEEITPFRNKENELFETFKSHCDWLKNLGNMYRIESQKIMERCGRLKEQKDRILAKFDDLQKDWSRIELFFSNEEEAFEIIKNYQENELTKLELYDILKPWSCSHSFECFHI